MKEIGRIVYKKKGREAGRKAVIVDLKQGHPVIEGKHVRRRVCNSTHLYYTKETAKISKNAGREEVLKALGEKEDKSKGSKEKKPKAERLKKGKASKAGSPKKEAKAKTLKKEKPAKESKDKAKPKAEKEAKNKKA